MNIKVMSLALGGALMGTLLMGAPLTATAETADARSEMKDLKQETKNDIKGVKVDAQRKIQDIKNEAREDAGDIRNDVRDMRQDARDRYDSAREQGQKRYEQVRSDVQNGYTGNTRMMSDSEIKNRVASAISSYGDVDVSTDNGVVKLTGTVKTQQDKDAVIDRARTVGGVTTIKDEIQVGEKSSHGVGGYIDDAATTTVVKSKFLGQEGLDSLDINVQTVNGVVTLNGEVENDAQIGLAESVAKEADGARRVVNNLTVKAN